MTDPSQIAARLAAITPAPWEVRPDGGHGARTVTTSSTLHPQTFHPVLPSWGGDKNAEFIAAAPSDIAYLLAQRDAVLKLHVAFEWSFGFGPVKSCRECARLGASETDAAYPCATVLAMGGGQ